jgi:hypothetical protein
MFQTQHETDDGVRHLGQQLYKTLHNSQLYPHTTICNNFFIFIGQLMKLKKLHENTL